MKEKIYCRIDYVSSHDPKCRISVNGETIHEFIANGKTETVRFEVSTGFFDLRIQHFGKDMKRDHEKFIEIKKIYFNDIDIKNMLWDTTQVPELPKWQSPDDFEWKSNLYLGHNGYVEYKMKSPVVDYLLEYHTKDVEVNNIGSYNMDLLREMKEFFSKIVNEQENGKK